MIMCLCIRGGNDTGGMCLCTPKWKAKYTEKKFYDKLVYEWKMKGTKKLTLEIGDFNGHVGKKMDRFESVHWGNGIGKRNLKGRMLLEFCDQKNFLSGKHMV